MKARGARHLFAYGLSMMMIMMASYAHAHDIKPGAVALVEGPDGVFRARLTAPIDGGGQQPPLRVRWPDGCQQSGAIIRCQEGLHGTLTLEGLDVRRSKVLVHISRQGGHTERHLLVEGEHQVELGGQAQSLMTYVILGMEHLLTGLDHALFIIALMLICTTGWMRVWALLTFTFAHGLTMGAATLGWIITAPTLVELLIAASILHVACEVLRPGLSLSRTAPWAMAMTVGLIHGLGFAGTFEAYDLPRSETMAALVLFHIGLEAGQLSLLAGAWPLWVFASRTLGRVRALRGVGYTLGLSAGAIFVDRFALWVTSLSP